LSGGGSKTSASQNHLYGPCSVVPRTKTRKRENNFPLALYHLSSKAKECKPTAAKSQISRQFPSCSSTKQKDKKPKSKPTKEITHHHQRSPTELVAHYEIIFWAV